jgi:A/G-specific adenine glycosylase
MMSPMSTFAVDLIEWQRVHGRHDLPWQGTRDPYRIWVSEVMLQQTQVAIVIPYYQRFLARFPDIASLANAPLDEVLALWSGLGYYSRARNLHAAAVEIRASHDGVFPMHFEAVVGLPGIGRSTASAILVFARGARLPILDGNVKRVLARCFGIAGYPGESAVAARLWHESEALLPRENVEAYTQALMDLGAAICVRRSPLCDRCPVRRRCVARRTGAVHELPMPRPRRPLPHRSTTMLVLRRGHDVLLEKRPPAGVWGGLWCFPEIASDDDPVRTSAERFGIAAVARHRLAPVEHAFTHFRLTITALCMDVERGQSAMHEAGSAWWPLRDAARAALPAPVRRIVQALSG